MRDSNSGFPPTPNENVTIDDNEEISHSEMMKQLGLTVNESTMTTSVEIPNININMAQSLNMSMSINK